SGGCRRVRRRIGPLATAGCVRRGEPRATLITNRASERRTCVDELLLSPHLTKFAAAGVYAIFARDLSGARARLAGRSPTIDTSPGILEYAMMGDGGPALIIHGAGGGFDQAIDMAGALAGRGYRLIAPSRFGYLGTPLPTRLVTAMQADAYAELFDRL